ncbi:unnamed protein product [Schistosoma margrebowiei]|uniref:Kinesin-like protein n=1 Tax=Schistosoma margrebowiei TaxID=48269 RepID=A0A3P7VZV1_9TREM|nr:unnamed protein product [Schistosoma margrebowiei]
MDASESVKVVVRCRPLNEKEASDGHKKCVFVDCSNGTIEVRNPIAKLNDDPKRFSFDAMASTEPYLLTDKPEPEKPSLFRDDPELRGVMPNSFVHIFDHISKSMDAQYLVRASYLEIYKEEIRDLLRRDQSKHLEIREKPDSGIFVKDLSSVLTKSIDEIQKVMKIGYQNRAFAITRYFYYGEKHIRVGKLNLVDLAGSERQSKTLSEGERLKEATKINLSLSTLGNVISALVDGKSTHIPYRDSKLTRLLQDSLGGNSKTIMIANIGPATYNYEETINTLRYANRAKNIRNKPKINEDPKDALLREYQEEINRLKSLLRNSNSDREDDATSIENYMKEQQLESKLRAMESKLLRGDQSIVEHTRMQEVTLAQQRTQMAEQKRREREIVARMEEEEGSMANLQEGFTSLKQEVEVNTRKLKKLFEKLQVCCIFGFLKHEKIQDQLTRQIKLQLLILENFIPIEEKEKLEKRIYFNEETERWQLKPLFQSSDDGTNLNIPSCFDHRSSKIWSLSRSLTFTSSVKCISTFLIYVSRIGQIKR